MKPGCALSRDEWIFFSTDENIRYRKTMSSGGLPRSVILSAFILLRAVTGFSGDGRTIWSKNPNFSPVNESQLFLYDTFPKNFLGRWDWSISSGRKLEGRQKDLLYGITSSNHTLKMSTPRIVPVTVTFFWKGLISPGFYRRFFLSIFNFLAKAFPRWNSISCQ